MWTSHQPHTSSGTWSPTASTLWGWRVTAARAHLTGRPGWSCAPKKEVSLSSEEMFVFTVSRVWGGLLWSASRSGACYLATDWGSSPSLLPFPLCTVAVHNKCYTTSSSHSWATSLRCFGLRGLFKISQSNQVRTSPSPVKSFSGHWQLEWCSVELFKIRLI